MKKYTKAQQVQIGFYGYKIQQAWANREKHYAKELEKKLDKLMNEFDLENSKKIEVVM